MKIGLLFQNFLFVCVLEKGELRVGVRFLLHSLQMEMGMYFSLDFSFYFSLHMCKYFC